ncbi:unnamed protein product [Absidia cylindrospora]
MAIEVTATNPQFTFSNHEYRRLEEATIICACFSIFAAFLVLSMYCYLLKYHPVDANRVSLHCVIFSIILSTLSQALNLTALRSDIENGFCNAFRVMDNLFTLISSCLLAMVGVYLLLLFHFHIHYWPCRPEFILMPIAVVYSIFGNIRSYLYDDTPDDFHAVYLKIPHLCWYYVNLIDRLYNMKTWYYYYSFIFFIIVVSFFSSMIAMRAVYVNKVSIEKRLAQIATSATTQLDPSSTTLDDKIKSKEHDSAIKKMISRSIKRNSNPFSKIVIRSLLYPLTPCIVYIWGFGLQMYLIDKSHRANFVVAMISNAMIRLEGCFIAIIFFMDPTVLRVLSGFWKKFKTCLPSFPRRRSTPSPSLEKSSDATLSP